MPDAAKRWTAAMEDPSKLIAENERLAAENNEWLRASRVLVSGDEQQEIEAERIMDALLLGNHGICCPVPFTEVMEKKCAELHAAYASATAEIERLNGDVEHAVCQLTNALIREQELWNENRNLKDELEAAPKWVIAANAKADGVTKPVIVRSGSGTNYITTAFQLNGTWRTHGIEGDVLHVLENLQCPDVSGIDPRGDGDIEEVVPDTDTKITNEKMADTFDEMIEKAKQMDAIAVSSNDLAGDASDIERAIRERLLQPFLGSEAEILGAKTYQLRNGECWQNYHFNSWRVSKSPCWFSRVQYRLAIRRVTCKD